MTDTEKLNEAIEAFEKARNSLIHDYMYMGQGETHAHLTQEDKREYKDIHVCGGVL